MVGFGGGIDDLLRKYTKDIADSSKRMERLTKVLIGVTAVLTVLTTILIIRTF